MFFRKKKAEQTLYDRLEQVILKFPGTKAVFRLTHFLAGILITGASRSGKTSAVLKFLVKQWFKAGFGGLFTSTRVGDAQMIKRWAEESGRGDDVILFDGNSNYSFAPLEYEMNRPGGGDVNQIANNLLMIHEVISTFEAGSGRGGNEDPFWKNAFKTLTVMSISLLKMADRPITWTALRKVALDSFTEEDVNAYVQQWKAIEEYRQKIEDDPNLVDELVDPWVAYQAWMENNYFLSCLDAANSKMDLNEEERETLGTIIDYWMRQFPKLAEKTKSIIVEILQSATRNFETSGILKRHFSNGVSPEIHPDRTIFDNKIIIIGFGVKEHGINGLCATAIIKLIYQQAWERRDLDSEGVNANPVMLMIDEFQYYINPTYDTLFTSTAGGSLVASVMVTQNFDNVVMGMGAQSPEARARSLMGNLSTKIHCANSNYSTNKWASDMIGSHFVDTTSLTIGGSNSGSQGYSQTLYPKVPTEHFTTLKTGRAENKYCIETIVTQTGRIWDTGQNFREVTFKQTD